MQGSSVKHLTRLQTLRIDIENDAECKQVSCQLDGIPAAVRSITVCSDARDVKICSWPGPTRKRRIELSTHGKLLLEDAARRLLGCNLGPARISDSLHGMGSITDNRACHQPPA